MIDMENKVVDTVRSAILLDSSATSFFSEPVAEIKKFPCVVIYESGNDVSLDHTTLDKVENIAVVRYTVNVYSAKQNGKKAEAKHIFKVIDNAMSQMGFRRSATDVVPSMDRTVHQIIAQYVGKVNLTVENGNNYYTVYCD